MRVTIRPADPRELDVVVAVDDDAGRLYTEAGVDLSLPADAPFARDEQARWLRAAERQRLFVASDDEDRVLGFAALDVLDGEPYLDQLSVRFDAMRRGIGRLLLARAHAWSEAQDGAFLWLTTYGHLPWNRAFYERCGFVTVPRSAWGPDIARHIAEQRRWLPHPEERVAMRRPITR
ncbi:MAG TPA: GNAT family N-acetyltransferase [Candidatus Binatia bacterium]|jgi:GNAT superfamily N-acetyltransferase|nr:GNAT family N-acetyltransferase [Candidatus Binatia bacterium]